MPSVGNGLADRSGDRFYRGVESVVFGQPFLLHKTPKKRFDNAVHGPEENGALTKNVAFIFILQRRDKRVRRPNRNGPANGLIRRLAIDVLHHRKAGIDARPR